MHRAQGFTLVELVVALTLAAIVLGFSGMLITAPLQHYEVQSRRAELADSASAAWPRLREELRTALPNSARVRRAGSFVALEFLAAVDWVRYQGSPGASIISSGVFRGIPVPWTSTSHFLSVNNRGSGVIGADAWALSGAISGVGSSINIIVGALPGEQLLTVNPPAIFASDSPRRRAYLVSGPVTYLCDETGGTVSRYAGYSIAAAQSQRDSAAELLAAGAAVQLLARDVTRCDFAVSAGSTTSGQLVTARITATRAGDTFELTQQAVLENLP